jgi:hypothetical protein
VADAELEAAAKALGLGDEPALPCPDCDRTFPTRMSLAQHRRSHRAPEAKPGPSVMPSDLVVAEVIGKTVANLQVMGGYLSIVLPHVGVAISGVPGEKPEDPPVVRSRAIMAGRLLEQWAKRDERVLKALDRFNALFETSEVVELAAGLGAAVAVDLGAVPADLAIEIGPFVGEQAIMPVRAVIGDVLAYVELVRQEQSAELTRPVVPDGRASDGAAVIHGGVEST